MPDSDGNKKTSEQDLQETSLHAYKDGRSDDVKGDPTGADVTEAPVEKRQDPDKH